MPAPSSSNALTLGRPLVDKSAFRPDTDPAVIRSFELVHQTMVGMGWPSPAFDGDTAYLGVFAFDNGDGTHTLYGGSPTDPTNPSALSISGGATISVSDEGTPLGGAFTTLDFVGAGVTATDAGGGTATITISGGGGGGGTYTAGDGLTLTVAEFSVIGHEGIVVDGSGVSVELATDPGLEFDAAGAAGKLRAKAGTYIDVDSNGISVDLTEIAGYSGASAFQIIKHESGTLGWGNYTAGTGISITDGTIECTVVDTDTTYTAGTDIDITAGVISYTGRSASLAAVMIQDAIDPATINGPGLSCIAGEGLCYILNASGATLTDSSREARCFNLRKTPVRASSAQPIVTIGMLVTAEVEGEDEYRVYLPSWDMRDLPDFSTAAAQGPYHESGDADFKLGGEVCA